MDYKSLKETLKDNGIEEEKIAKIINDLEAKKDDAEEEENDEVKEDESEESTEDEEEVPPQTSEEEVQEVPPTEEGAPLGDEEQEQEEGTVPPENAEDVPPTDVPPTEVIEQQEEGSIPPNLPDTEALIQKIEEQKLVIEEQQKALDGVLARIKSLEDALAGAGVLDKQDADDEDEEVGYSNEEVPNSGSNGAIDPYDDALAMLNGKRHR